jgi:Flp pilus assembly pilin Flp
MKPPIIRQLAIPANKHWRMISFHNPTEKNRQNTVMQNALKRFLADERGSAMVEYCVLVGGIFLAAFAAFQIFSAELRSFFLNIAASVHSINNTPKQ